MNTRKVIVSRNLPLPRVEGQSRTLYALQPVGEAAFHQFGVGYEEFESGAGNYSTAIVEWPNGDVENVPVEHIKFVSLLKGTT